MSKLKFLFEKHGDFFKEQQAEIGQMLRGTMKFYWHEGRAYPSVTSIINPTGMSHFAAAYGARGTIVHYLFWHYIRTGEWLDWRNCQVLEKEIYIMERDRRKVRLEDANYMGFMLEYGARFQFDRDSLEKRFFNDEYGYTGRPDSEGLYSVPNLDGLAGGPYITGAPSVFEYKSIGTYNKRELDTIFMQLAAYAFGINKPRLWGVCIPLNGKTKIGYAPPIVRTDLKPYFEKFMQRRQALRDLYGI